MELARIRRWQGGLHHHSPLKPRFARRCKAAANRPRAYPRSLEDAADRDHEQIYLVGGSWRVIARLDMELAPDYPMTVLHEYR